MMADGFIIFILNQILSLFNSNPSMTDGIKMSKNKLLGILVVAIGNVFLALFWQPLTCLIALGHIITSIVEFFLLESATA